MLAIVLFAMILISANMLSRAEGPMFWAYVVSLGLSLLAAVFVAGMLWPAVQRNIEKPIGSRFFALVLAGCYLSICGGTITVVWFNLPLDRVAFFIGVVPGWLAIDWILSREDSGHGRSTTHELRSKRSGARYGDATHRQVYESQHGAGSWKQSQQSQRHFLKIVAFGALACLFWYVGFYELIAVLACTVFVLAATRTYRSVQ